MKRIFLSALAALGALLLFTSCLGEILKPQPPDMDISYKIGAEITFDDFEAKAELQRQSQGKWKIAFSEPYALSGLTLAFDSGEITAELEGITAEVTESESYTNLASIILSALDNAATGEGFDIVTTDDIIQLSGKTEYGDYTLKFDKASKTPVSLAIDGRKISVAFSDMEKTEREDVDAVLE
ncbi:MAG: hypothetical protein ACI4J1_02460 [Ruminiclostridium sp.]